MNTFEKLPEECLAEILSMLTTPRDILRSSAVSKQFLAASVSDTVWDKFLPSDCHHIISQSSSFPCYNKFMSKKDLFIYLSHFPLLLDNSTKSFALDKWSGNICYMLGARELSVIWGSNNGYWSWEYVPESRFPECAVLKDMYSLEIKGQVHTTLLSPDTTYGAYFVFKIKADSFSASFGRTPVKVFISVVSEDGLPRDDNHITEIKRFYLKAPSSDEEYGQFGVRTRQRFLGELPVVRDDGWMEIEMGKYQVGVRGGDEKALLEMTLKEVEISHWKLVVHGVEVRPYVLTADREGFC